MKKIILFLSILFTCYLTAQNKQIDVVYLNNGSVIKGTITELIVNENLTIKTLNGSVIITEMTSVKKITKQSLKDTDHLAKNDSPLKAEIVTNTNEISEEKPKKKKKGTFWKALGNVVVSTLDKTADDIRNRRFKNSPSEDIEEDYEESIDESNEIEETVGSVCFVNPNFYSRKILLTNNSTATEKMIIVGNANYGKTTKSCAYDIPAGIYNCKIYTTQSRRLIGQYQIRIISGNAVSQLLTKNQYN